nr:hypothetical protein [Salinispora arenicola]
MLGEHAEHHFGGVDGGEQSALAESERHDAGPSSHNDTGQPRFELPAEYVPYHPVHHAIGSTVSAWPHGSGADNPGGCW